eukprot:365750-Chlamydomonas_euryale.AAC.19
MALQGAAWRCKVRHGTEQNEMEQHGHAFGMAAHAWQSCAAMWLCTTRHGFAWWDVALHA